MKKILFAVALIATILAACGPSNVSYIYVAPANCVAPTATAQAVAPTATAQVCQLPSKAPFMYPPTLGSKVLPTQSHGGSDPTATATRQYPGATPPVTIVPPGTGTPAPKPTAVTFTPPAPTVVPPTPKPTEPPCDEHDGEDGCGHEGDHGNHDGGSSDNSNPNHGHDGEHDHSQGFANMPV